MNNTNTTHTTHTTHTTNIEVNAGIDTGVVGALQAPSDARAAAIAVAFTATAKGGKSLLDALRAAAVAGDTALAVSVTIAAAMAKAEKAGVDVARVQRLGAQARKDFKALCFAVASGEPQMGVIAAQRALTKARKEEKTTEEKTEENDDPIEENNQHQAHDKGQVIALSGQTLNVLSDVLQGLKDLKKPSQKDTAEAVDRIRALLGLTA